MTPSPFLSKKATCFSNAVYPSSPDSPSTQHNPQNILILFTALSFELLTKENKNSQHGKQDGSNLQCLKRQRKEPWPNEKIGQVSKETSLTQAFLLGFKRKRKKIFLVFIYNKDLIRTCFTLVCIFVQMRPRHVLICVNATSH